MVNCEIYLFLIASEIVNLQVKDMAQQDRHAPEIQPETGEQINAYFLYKLHFVQVSDTILKSLKS